VHVRNPDGSGTLNYNCMVSSAGSGSFCSFTVQANTEGNSLALHAALPISSQAYSGSYSLPASTPCDTDLTDSVTATGTVADTTLCAAVADRSVSDTKSATSRTAA